MGFTEEIVAFDGLVNQVAELAIVGVPETFKAPEVRAGDFPGLRADLLLDQGVDAVVKSHLQGRDEI